MTQAVILYSVGSPDTLSSTCLKEYLNRFLSDKLVVKMPRVLWQPILQNIILRTRPKRLLSRYEQIFVDGKNPYFTVTDSLCLKLEDYLNQEHARLNKEASPLANEDCSAETIEKSDNTKDESFAQALKDAFVSENQDNEDNPKTTANTEHQTNTSSQIKSKSFIVKAAYAYCEPYLQDVVAECIQQGATRITTIPLFPQYSDTTSKRPFLTLRKLKEQYANQIKTGELTFDYVRSYKDHPVYINAMCELLKNRVQQILKQTLSDQLLTETSTHILITYHSLPQSYIKLGDPYLKECMATTEAIISNLALTKQNYSIAFQSKLGPMAWLKPYIEDEVEGILEEDKQRLIVIAPGFSVDNLETLYDLNIALREQFLYKGGDEFTYISCLNDSEYQVKLLSELIKEAELI